jgi:YtoQ family protein
LSSTFARQQSSRTEANVGDATLAGPEPNKFWHDHKGAKINAIRTRTMIETADIVIVRFGEKYKQWNAAFDAGYAAALNTPLIIMHGPEHAHALKEVDAAALAVAETVDEIVAILRYVVEGQLDVRKLKVVE